MLKNIAYKVVTQDRGSLGLRKNPNILIYQLGMWTILQNHQIIEGKQDYGGIWAATKLSGAKKLQKYMKEKYNRPTRIFKSQLGEILYSNSYRIKTNKIKLLEEIES